YQRLRAERPDCPIAESTVRRYVRERKAALGLLPRETFVPQSYPWGSEAQVDWYDAVADLGDERVTLQVFVMRSMASGAAFHRAYRHATQQAFLDAHQHAFHYFGGVFHRVRYDNLSAAIKRVLRESLALAEVCGAPYERALTLLMMAELHAVQGMNERAHNHLDDACGLLVPLGARPALDRADALTARLSATREMPAAFPAGLTAREAEVLRHIAAGESIQEIAD